jgi:hypothetical protein
LEENLTLIFLQAIFAISPGEQGDDIPYYLPSRYPHPASPFKIRLD